MKPEKGILLLKNAVKGILNGFNDVLINNDEKLASSKKTLSTIGLVLYLASTKDPRPW